MQMSRKRKTTKITMFVLYLLKCATSHFLKMSAEFRCIYTDDFVCYMDITRTCAMHVLSSAIRTRSFELFAKASTLKNKAFTFSRELILRTHFERFLPKYLVPFTFI